MELKKTSFQTNPITVAILVIGIIVLWSFLKLSSIQIVLLVAFLIYMITRKRR